MHSHVHANGVEDSSIVKQKKKGQMVIINTNTYSKEPSFGTIWVNSQDTLFDETLFIVAELHKGKNTEEDIFWTIWNALHSVSENLRFEPNIYNALSFYFKVIFTGIFRLRWWVPDVEFWL